MAGTLEKVPPEKKHEVFKTNIYNNTPREQHHKSNTEMKPARKKILPRAPAQSVAPNKRDALLERSPKPTPSYSGNINLNSDSNSSSNSSSNVISI